MNFLAPAAFLLGLLLPVIVAMYLLKLRRTERTISSVYLWRRMVRDVEANAPWQRLRPNLLLFLQLLVLIALVLALARPFTWVEGAGGQALIVVLDTSASMAATDVTPNRLEAAKDQARSLISSLPDGARVTVIAAGNQPRVLLASSQDRRQALLALENVDASAGGSDLAVALELASAIAARQPDAEIAVLSDGGVTLPDRLALQGRLRYWPIGLSNANSAISALSLEGSPGGGLVAFAQVSRYGSQPEQRRLALYADGALFNVYDLQLVPGVQRTLIAEDLPAETQVLEARLESAGGSQTSDVLSLDDRALAVRRSGGPTTITVVTQGNLFLQTAVDLLPGLQATFITPEQFEAGEVSTEEDRPQPSLTIFDNYIPLTATLPTGNLFFIAPIASTEYFTVTGRVDSPQPRPVQAEDPLLRYVSLADVHLLDAVRLSLPDWARTVIAGDTPASASTLAENGLPLLFAGESEGRRLAVLAFDLRRSDLPLQVAFPLLWANLIGWLAPGSAGQVPAALTPGDPLALSLSPEVSSVTVTPPGGRTTRLQTEKGQVVFDGADQLGLYSVAWQEGQTEQELLFAVNLFSPQESSIEPADALPGAAAQQAAQAAESAARREWWRPLALLGLGVLTAEWLVYQRAALARLRDRVRLARKK